MIMKKKKRDKDGNTMKKLPQICQKCGYRVAGDPNEAMKFQVMIEANQNAIGAMWQAVGRALNDAHSICPAEKFGLKFPTGEECLGGDDDHPHWKCWTFWMGEEMGKGKYMEKKKEDPEDERKTDPE